MNDLAAVLEASEARAETVLETLCDVVSTRLELILFTVMELDLATGMGRRSFTSDPVAYPVGGEKPLLPTRWTEQVVGRKETFVANRIADLTDIFPDHDLIRSLGCESCLNLPIVVGGDVLGTVNCLGPADHFTAKRVAAAQALRPEATLALLAARHLRTRSI